MRTALLTLALVLAAPAHAPAVEVLRVTVATTATLIYATTTNTARTVLVRNPSGVSVYVGNADVTTATGFEIAAGDAASFTVEPNDSLYGIVAAATAVVHRVAGVK